ncbi:hypothetical protein [Plebeiibacterium marinum]|uniref:Ribbon-helix-helix domain-containing protein n=1 Tax=Plebeiibacterium marinum TaxID=2992111 RepID=A0AAE3ME32_9BACT|nr:hypothetical protein [Plebeiobacterium marinum]MCW3805741.1 ribbon-helix-helix domain-containing protein [Plebeiobacterium marinum]
MKKQSLNIRSTLKPKVELTKQPKQIRKIEDDISEIHHSRKKEMEDYFRTTIYLPKTLHTELKVYVAQNKGLSIKEFITEAVREKLGKYIY